jgi:streptogramin lyase
MAALLILVLGTGLAGADIVSGLQAHWTLDEDSGLTAFDASGNGHHASWNTSFSVETIGVPGIADTAYDFEMDDIFVLDAGTSLQLSGGNAATVAAYVRPESYRGGSGAGSRNGMLGDTTADFIFRLEDQGLLGFTWDAGTDNYQSVTADPGDELPRGGYSHVAAVRDGTTMRLYVDGQEVKSGSVAASNFVTFGNMQLGRVNGTSSRDFDGRMDDLRVYNRALSPGDVQELADLSATNVLIANTGSNQVLGYDVVGSTWTPAGTFASGTYAGEALQNPFGLAQDGGRRIYISEQRDGGRILRFNFHGTFQGVVATEGTDFNGRPEALTIGPDGNLYFSAAFGSDSDYIYKVDLATDTVSTFVPTSGTGYTLSDPRGIAFGSDGNLYVANRNNDQILEFDGATGAFTSVFATEATPQGLIWSEEEQKLFASVFGFTDWFQYLLDGTATKIYNANVGPTLGFATINGGLYGTDYSGNRLVRLVDFNNLDTVLTGFNGPGHILEFSDVPEPTTLSLLGLGALALARRRRKTRQA